MKAVEKYSENGQPLWVIGGIFALSGAAGLMYQVVWQRMLFTVFGVDLQSITVIVTVFMLGLGLGGLLGGWLSDRFRMQCFKIFLISEALIGCFGLVSPFLIGELTYVYDVFWVFIESFTLLLFPTLLMGVTLPLLSVALVDSGVVIADAVGRMYFFNTIGAAVGCILSGFVLFSIFGLVSVVYLAAAMNGIAVVLGLLLIGVRK